MSPYRKALLSILVLLVLIGAVLLQFVAATLNAAGAKILCSAVYISRRSASEVIQDDLLTAHQLARYQRYETGSESASASFLGLWPRRAIFRPGLGCTLLTDVSEADLRAQPLPEARVAPPLEDPLPASPLDPLLEKAFEEPDPVHPLRTRALLVMRDGRFVAERYAPGFHRDMPLLSWSMAKSITNALLGLGVASGGIDLHQPAAVPEWSSPDDPRHAITVEDLLRMSSGLAFAESRSFLPSDAMTMLFRRPNAAAYAAGHSLVAPPGTRWTYSSGTTNILSRLLRDSFHGDLQAYWNFPRQVLFDSIGARHMLLEPDPSGTFVGSSFAYATARDWARFAQFYLQDGVVNGRRLLPEGWVRLTTTPAPAAPHGCYGAHVWLNGGAGSERQWPGLPADTFSFQGYEGQLVIVVPSQKVVCVRLGLTRVGATWDANRYLPPILAALK